MPISTTKINPYIQLFILAAVLAAAVYAFLFLKTYFYPAITGSQTILELQKNRASDTINLEQFNNLIKNIGEKTAAKTNELPVSDPFK
jgi:hypothetical protein